MKYETSTGVTTTFAQDGKYGQPSVILDNVPGIHGIHTYHAAQFLDVAARGGGFIVGADWDGQEPFRITESDVAAIATMVREQCDRRKGYFEMRWVALDPSLPF